MQQKQLLFNAYSGIDDFQVPLFATFSSFFVIENSLHSYKLSAFFASQQGHFVLDFFAFPDSGRK